jgi:hypothetical protein
MEHLGKVQIDTRKIERSPQYTVQTITDSIENYTASDETQATKDTKLKLFAPSTKNTKITERKIYTDGSKKKTKKLDTQ